MTRASERVPKEEAGRLMRRATYASVATATTLILAKMVAWIATDSVSLLSALIDSMLDVAASLVTLVAVRQALVPPDADHRFGHGKAEPLAALGQAAFITGSAVFLIFEAVRRFVEPQPLVETWTGIGVMGFSIALTLILVRYQHLVSRRTGSLAIKADSLHYVGDLLTNVAVIAALLLTMELGYLWIDPVIALLIAAYILRTAWSVARHALDMLMDKELPAADRQRIVQLIYSEEGVKGLHDLRTRSSGPQVFIQLHLELVGSLPFSRAHEIADRVERKLAEAYHGAEVIVHQDLYDESKTDLRRGIARPA